MRTLFLDTASHAGLLALADEKRVLGSEAIDRRIDDAELVERLERFLARNRSSYKDVGRIACVVGPGGFTSLRVAAGLGNALAHALDAPVSGIHLSDLYAARCMEKEFVWLHSTKKKEAFVRRFGGPAPVPEASCVSLDELRAALPPGGRWTGELIPEHEAVLAAAGLAPAALRPLDEVLPRFLAEIPADRTTLLPWYGRGW